ncbi:MAG: hypothetical protein ABI165_06960 [Bryobacteraceae bacterium]
MKAICVVLVLAVNASLLLAQRHKLDFDPETKQGFLLEQIQQEPDPTAKFQLLEQFAVTYPKHESIAWVYEQIEPLYMQAQQYDKELDVGAKMLAVDPNDLETAQSCLRAANALKKPDDIGHYAAVTWELASKGAQSQNAAQADYAKKVMSYAEYSQYALASATTDLNKRLELMKALTTWNPHSQYLKTGDMEAFRSYQQMGQAGKAIGAAEQILTHDPENVDMLMAVAEYHFKKEDSRAKVIADASKASELLEAKARPENVSAGDWDQKRATYLGAAYYMCGFISSLEGRYAQADRNLRAALPYLKEHADMLATALYHLGFANYKLAESGEKGRVMDALKFMRECASMPSTYQEQAVKNIEAIKSEYNLQ